MNAMSTRFAKQLVYGAFYIIVWGLAVWAGYRFFARAAPSCFDGVQNQGELGVDCGGPCAKVCAASTKPLAILTVNAFTASAGRDTFLAKIANPNSDYAAQSFDYAFNVYDASGALLQSFPAHSFLYSQEVKYLLLANQPIPGNVARADITISNVHWVTGAMLGIAPQLAVQNVAMQTGSSTVLATGQVIDNDTAAFNNILIIGIFKDAQGNPVGASQTIIDAVAPNQTKNFLVSYPAVPGVNPAATEVVAYAMR